MGVSELTTKLEPHNISVLLQEEKPRGLETNSSNDSDVTKQVQADEKAFSRRVHIQLWSVVACYVGCNVVRAMMNKWSNRQQIPDCDGCAAAYYVAPFFQTFIMFVGECACILLYMADVGISKCRSKQQIFEFPTSTNSFSQPTSPFYVWFAPAMIDLAGSVMGFYTYVFLDASVVVLLGNFRIVLTCIFALLIFKVALRWYHYAGVVLATTGLLLTGATAFQNTSSETAYGPSWIWLGVVLTVGDTSLHSFQYVFEEFLYRKYRCSPLKAVGCEGIFGLVAMSIILPILQATGIESTAATFYQLQHHAGLLTWTIVSIPIILANNVSAQATAKLGSALFRAVWSNSGKIFIWLLDVVILQWAQFQATELFGLAFIIAGIMWYNNFVRFPCWPAYTAWVQKPLVCLCLRDPDAVPGAKPTEPVDASKIVC